MYICKELCNIGPDFGKKKKKINQSINPPGEGGVIYDGPDEKLPKTLIYPDEKSIPRRGKPIQSA